MDNEKKSCPACGQIVAPWLQRCPACNALVNPPPGRASQAAPDDLVLQAEIVPDSPPAMPLPNVAVFPERMKANKVLAERSCSGCAQPIDIGDEVWNCQSCGNTMHQACHDASQACGNRGCPTRPKAVVKTAVARPAYAAGGVPGAVEAGELVPCRFCGEMIQKKARRCRFCNEYQNDADRARAVKDAKVGDSLSATEILFCFLCPNIACIMGIVWMVQGQSKGWKMLLLSLLGQVVHGVLYTAVKH